MPLNPNNRSERIVRFLREQDGIPERELKTVLVAVFRHTHKVQRAYLAYAEYENPLRHDVVLGLRMKKDADVVAEVATIQEIFSRMFGKGQSLDIIAVNEDQELHLVGACRPFFSA